MRLILLVCLSFLSVAFFPCIAQEETVVTGRIMEKGKAEPIPFVSIGFKGTKIGATSDFEGNFTIRTILPVDSIIVSYVGYKTARLKVVPGQKQFLKIELAENTNDLLEVVIRPGENPALRIIKRAQEMRDRNDSRKLAACEYDNYTKIDVSMDNISEKMRNNKLFKPIKGLFDTANQIKNEEGKYILPIMISETFSRFYQNNDPSISKEIIKASSITGFGVEQGSYIIDMLGGSLLQFNFNQNWLRLLGKDFISPIASGSNSYYIYTLRDSTFIDGLKCYQIQLNLRREEDLGFIGTMWITDSTYAIKRIQVELSPSANINFIERLKVQQEMIRTGKGPWVPYKTRLIVDVAQLSANTSSFIAKMYRTNSNYILNQKKPPEFFDVQIERDYESTERDSNYWDTLRTEPFTTTEKQMFTMIDSVKNLPAVKTYLDIVRLVLEGYYRRGKVDIGPYLLFVGYNEVQGMRFRLGLRTNMMFSKHWVFRPYIAYGFKDEKVKYGLGIDYVLSRKKWCIASIQFKDDYDIIGVTDVNQNNTLQVNNGMSNLFAALSFGAPGTRINRTMEVQANFIKQMNRDWTYRVGLQHTYFEPVGSFVFAYEKNPHRGSSRPPMLAESFRFTAASFELRYAYKELMVIRGSQRFRMTMPKAPAFTFLYTRGFRNLLGGDFDYDKFQLNISQHITTGFLGNADFSFTIGKIFGRLPYPMLDVPRGNPTVIYSDKNYSLMSLYEFVADEYSQASYIQHFEGLFTNRIPLLRKWRLRNFGAIKMAYGHITDQNKLILPATNSEGRALSPVYQYRNEPYTEVAYGFENIFKFISISSVHRLTYLSNKDARKWGLNVGISIVF
ncbi:MAG: DUF5686 family protein [Bacteroidota bacterium]